MTGTADKIAVRRVLNGALHVEARSVLAYALMVSEGLESELADDVEQGLVQLRSQLGESASHLANLILEWGGTPDPGNFPLVATNFNFLKVPVLLERVEPTVPGDAATLQQLAGALSEPADIHALLADLAKQKTAQHKVVQDLLAKLNPPPPKPEPAPAEAEGGDAAAE